jgi:hypothetical protein
LIVPAASATGGQGDTTPARDEFVRLLKSFLERSRAAGEPN